VKAKSGPFVPCRLLVEVDQRQFYGVSETDVLELESGGRGPVRVAGVQGAAEASVGRTLRGHEHMFA
jgi:hypothetical protein